MPYKDPEIARLKSNERKRRWRKKKHEETYGPNAGPQNGKHGNQATGKNNGRWNSGEMVSSHGYVIVRVAKDNPLSFGAGYAYKHQMVWVNKHGEIAAGKGIHHKNGNKKDNRLSNLECLTTSAHQKYHADNTRKRDDLGRFAEDIRVREFPTSPTKG